MPRPLYNTGYTQIKEEAQPGSGGTNINQFIPGLLFKSPQLYASVIPIWKMDRTPYQSWEKALAFVEHVKTFRWKALHNGKVLTANRIMLSWVMLLKLSYQLRVGTDGRPSKALLKYGACWHSWLRSGNTKELFCARRSGLSQYAVGFPVPSFCIKSGAESRDGSISSASRWVVTAICWLLKTRLAEPTLPTDSLFSTPRVLVTHI